MKKGFTVYVLQSLRNHWLYIGLTNNLPRRLHEHNAGYNRSTKGKGPFRVILTETYPTRIEARLREKKLKTGIGREWIKAQQKQ